MDVDVISYLDYNH